jgi:hypothetical protein
MAHHHMRPRILPAPPVSPSIPATALDRLVDFAKRAPALSLAVTAGLALIIGLSVATPRRRRRW